MPMPSVSGLTSAFTARLPFLKRNRAGSHMRVHQRVPVCMMAELLIVDRGFKLDGLLIEVSRGGMRFREASAFILRRDRVAVVVQVDGGEYPGTIVNSGVNGYGIKLDSVIPQEEVDRLIARSTPRSVPTN